MKAEESVVGALTRRGGVGAAAGYGPASSRGTGAPVFRLFAIATVLAAAFLGLTASPALAIKAHVFHGSFGTSGSGAGQLSLSAPEPVPGEPAPSTVAVEESTGDVYVADSGNNRVSVFTSGGTFIQAFGWGVRDGSAELQTCTSATECQAGLAGLGSGELNSSRTIAVDNSPGGEGDIYVADYAEFEAEAKLARIQKFTPEGALVGSWGEVGAIKDGPLTGGQALTRLAGLAVDASGNLWALTLERLFEFSREGALLNSFTNLNLSGEPGFGIAFDSAGRLDLDGRLNIRQRSPDGTTDLGTLFEPSRESTGIAADATGSFYVAEGESIAVIAPGCQPAAAPPFCVAAEELRDPRLHEAGSLGADMQTGAVYAVEPIADSILSFVPEEPGVPAISDQTLTAATATGANLEAEVNPRSEPTEGNTEYHFEYGPCPTLSPCPLSPYPFSTAPGFLSPDQEPHLVSAQVSGLQPLTVYHFRVAATNDHGTGFGEESILTTEAVAPFGLPDSRQWELVSPARKLGARILPISEAGIVEAAADGARITYRASTPTEAEPVGYANAQQILSTRSSAGWSTRDLGIPHAEAVGATGAAEDRFFDSELHQDILQPFGEFDPALSPQASESTSYLRDLSTTCGVSCFRPLVTGKEGFANVPPETHFGDEEGGPKVQGATDDLAHLVLFSIPALATGAGEGQLYEWSAGVLSQISRLPDGQPSHANNGLGLDDHAIRRAISADGTRVVWSQQSGALYLRANATSPPSLSGACDEADKACTIELDEAESCPGCEGGGGRFQIASSDGSRIFFTDTHRLTGDSGANPTTHAADLYECHIVEASPGHLSCDLTDLTPELGGERALVQGAVLGASADGSYLYFVADGVLAGNSVEDGAGPESALARQPNLYLLHEGTTTFLANLAAGDEHDWSEELAAQPTRVSEDGRWLELMSERALTGYDNRDAASGTPVAEVYLYSAAAGRIRCASCEPSGSRPVGIRYEKIQAGNGGLVGAGNIWPSRALVAANVPGWNTRVVLNPTYQDRYLSDSGRLIFNTIDPLVPQDSNGNQDVYEYEPPQGPGQLASNSCTTASPTYSFNSQGCVDLISAGTSSDESAFLDASENGDDIFFLTRSKLVPQDEDSALDVYDAHVCTAEVPCLPEPPAPAPACEGDACQPPAVAPNDPSPGSLSFNGAGNVMACPKGKVAKQGRCVKKGKHRKSHHKKDHHKKSTKSHARHAKSTRGAGR